MSFFWKSRVVTGPRERSSSRPRYFMAGQSRMVAVCRTAFVPYPVTSCLTVCRA
jgi:hypothetical protein